MQVLLDVSIITLRCRYEKLHVPTYLYLLNNVIMILE